MPTAGRTSSNMPRPPEPYSSPCPKWVLEKTDVAILIKQLRDHTFSDDEEIDLDDAESLLKHVGKTGYLQLGFAHQGVMFLFETSTEWYERFQDLMEAATEIGGVVLDERDE